MKKNKKYLTAVFWMAMLLTMPIIILALVIPDKFNEVSGIVRVYLGKNYGWYYLLVVTLIVFVCVYIIFSPIGKIKLGDKDTKPEHSKMSWIAMLFSAGMGIGLVFYGAAEPLSHYAISAPEAELYSRQALKDALKYSFFHYGIHAWAIYAIVALSLAYFQFRKKETTLISVTLKPILGSKPHPFLAKLIDSVTIFATVIGVATTLGYGSTQINSGLNYLFGVPNNIKVQLIIIIVATCLFMLSALSGIGKGVKLLSNLNTIIALSLVVVIMIVGPRVQIMNTLVSTVGDYFQDFLRMSFRTGVGSVSEQEWIRKWTILYWSWWISWSPFVGIFIARISKGRTIREFLTHVLLIPSAISFLWFTVFGVLSIDVLNSGVNLTALPLEKILFATLEQYPLGFIMSCTAIVLIFSFFITSADSATYVLAMQSENGRLNPHNSVKIIWGIVLSLISSALLVAGGLSALQNVLIIVAFPFSIILVLMTISLVKELNYERHEMGLYIKPKKRPDEDEPFRSYED